MVGTLDVIHLWVGSEIDIAECNISRISPIRLGCTVPSPLRKARAISHQTASALCPSNTRNTYDLARNSFVESPFRRIPNRNRIGMHAIPLLNAGSASNTDNLRVLNACVLIHFTE